MAPKRQPGRPSRNQAAKAVACVGVAALPQDPRDVFEFRITEPNALMALFRVFGSYQCNLAYLVVEEQQLRIVARSADQNAARGSLDELRHRAHIVSATFNCAEVFYYHAHPEILGTYQLSLSEDRILSFMSNIAPVHTSVLFRIRDNDRGHLEICLKDSDNADEGTTSPFLIERLAPSFPIEPFFPENEHLELPVLSMTVAFDEFKKKIVMIAKDSPAIFEIFRAKDRPLQFKWRSPASQKLITHSFDNERIKLVDNSADRVVTFEVETNDIKRFFTSCKAPITQVQLSVMADGHIVIRSCNVHAISIGVFAGQSI